MRLEDSPLVAVLRDPSHMAIFDMEQWDLAIRQARAANLLGRLAVWASTPPLRDRVPQWVMRHMNAEISIVEKQTTAVHWEVKHIARALQGSGIPAVLLKGAAYAAAGLPAAIGRSFADVDILVPKADLAEVEKLLFLKGWTTGNISAYDDRYYRQWMHELAPMHHMIRLTPLDVHHNILPETARIQTRPELILRDALRLPGYDKMFIPSRTDQILHSATHLFHEGEWHHGLRDLSDIDLLIRAYSSEPAFWSDLTARAADLNLQAPLLHALRCLQRIFHTPIPEVPEQLGSVHGPVPRWSSLDAVFVSGLASVHDSFRTKWSGLAEFVLYIRSHWLRMPLRLLIPHLVHKSLTRVERSPD